MCGDDSGEPSADESGVDGIGIPEFTAHMNFAFPKKHFDQLGLVSYWKRYND